MRYSSISLADRDGGAGHGGADREGGAGHDGADRDASGDGFSFFILN